MGNLPSLVKDKASSRYISTKLLTLAFMKHVVLSLAAAFAVMTSGLAQVCDADFNFPADVAFGISPDPVAGETFDVGYFNEPYADTLHVLVPTDAVEFIGLPIPVDSIVVQNISLLGERGGVSHFGCRTGIDPNNNEDSDNPYTFSEVDNTVPRSLAHPDTTGSFVASVTLLDGPRS